MKVTVQLGEYVWRPLTASLADTEFVVSLRNSPVCAAAFPSPPITRQGHLAWAQSPARDSEINWIIERNGERSGQSAIYDISREHLRAEGGRTILVDPAIFYPNMLLTIFVGFEHLGLNRVYGHVLASNSPCWLIMQRLGAAKEGVLREHILKDGVPTDVLVYGFLGREWNSAKRHLLASYGTPRVLEPLAPAPAFQRTPAYCDTTDTCI